MPETGEVTCRLHITYMLLLLLTRIPPYSFSTRQGVRKPQPPFPPSRCIPLCPRCCSSRHQRVSSWSRPAALRYSSSRCVAVSSCKLLLCAACTRCPPVASSESCTQQSTSSIWERRLLGYPVPGPPTTLLSPACTSPEPAPPASDLPTRLTARAKPPLTQWAPPTGSSAPAPYPHLISASPHPIRTSSAPPEHLQHTHTGTNTHFAPRALSAPPRPFFGLPGRPPLRPAGPRGAVPLPATLPTRAKTDSG